MGDVRNALYILVSAALDSLQFPSWLLFITWSIVRENVTLIVLRDMSRDEHTDVMYSVLLSCVGTDFQVGDSHTF